MGTIDKLVAAGFSPAEVSDYRASESTKLSQAGFSPQEITNYLGTPHPEPDMVEANKSFAQAAGNALADAHNTSNGLPSSGIAAFAGALGKAGAQDAMDAGTLVGPLEAAANVATGAVLGFPGYIISGAGGLAAKALGANVDPADLASRVSQALTYQPKTGAGQRLASAVQAPLEWLNEKSLPAGQNVADFVADHGASPTSSKWAGAITAAAIQTLPAVLLGELGRKMAGERVTSADMQNTAKQIAGPDAKPETIASVENSLRATYAQTGIGPTTALEQTRIDPSIADEMKNPDVSVPSAFQPYMRREQIGVPVSDAMKAIRPLEAETPVPGPTEPTEVSPNTETPPAAEMPQESAQLPPAEIPSTEGEKPEEGFGAASNPQNLESSAPVRTNTQLADALQDALKQRDIDRAYQLYEQKIDNERSVIGNRAEAESLFSKYQKEDDDAITLMHSGLAPHEAIEAMKDLAGRIMQTDVGQRVGTAFDAGVRDLQMKTTPMATGSDRAMAVAKDAANAMRKAQWQWSAFDDLLKRGYSAEQREKMWNAADEENDLRTAGIVDQTKGLGRLNDDERQTVETLQQYGNSLLQRARDVGMFQGEGVQYWTPRMIAMIGEDGEVSAPPVERASSAEGRGGNISTSAGSLKGRKHATTAETEAAAKAKFGEGAQVVRDIRTMPMAMARIEKAIAGRELVNRIKEIGLQTGQETVSAGEKPEFFTIDHPAFKTYRPAGEQWVLATEAELSAKGYRAGNGQVWKSNPNTVNEYDPVAGYRVTADGKIERREMLMERAPLYISKEFEGPLKAIMTEKSGAIYNGLMALKGKTMGVIMYSPLIHNMVEWGRALPALPGKVLTGRVYFEGNAAKHDPVTMRRALDSGLVPIGHRFFNQDITGLLEEPNIKPGRSLTSQALAAPATLAGKMGVENAEGAANAIKTAVDKAGDVWHNTLLWDRVADLQMGLYTNLERDMVRKGLGPQTASRLAAHFANRYAGALPNEAMSAMARKFANLALFSRTFTLGNLGAMKDVFTGLPRDVQAQILRDAGEAARVGAVKAAQQKAIHAFVMDIALQYAGNAIMQNAMDSIQRDKSVPSILAGYAMRFKDYLTRAEQNPMDALRLDTLFPQSQNEPGKENRIFFKTQPDGTAIYVRLPTGKIGEEFQGYLTSPIDMLKRKQGTIARPLIQAFTNDKGFGQKVYDENEPGLKGMLDAVGNITWNILQEQVPVDSIAAGYHLMSGHGDEVDALKVVGPLLGMTFSKGAPGGPEVGVMFDAEKRHQDEVTRAMPGIKQDIKNGDMQDAIEKMEGAHFTPQEQRATLKYAMNPQARLNRNRLAKFEQIAPLEDLERMQRMQEEAEQSPSTNP